MLLLCLVIHGGTHSEVMVIETFLKDFLDWSHCFPPAACTTRRHVGLLTDSVLDSQYQLLQLIQSLMLLLYLVDHGGTHSEVIVIEELLKDFLNWSYCFQPTACSLSGHAWLLTQAVLDSQYQPIQYIQGSILLLHVVGDGGTQNEVIVIEESLEDFPRLEPLFCSCSLQPWPTCKDTHSSCFG